MALQIPAGYESIVGKERVNAGLRFRRIEEEFSLAVFLLHSVVTVHCELPKRLAVGGDTIAEDDGVNGVGECGQEYYRRDRNRKRSLHKMLDAFSQDGAHGVEIILPGRILEPNPSAAQRKRLPDFAKPAKSQQPRPRWG